MLGLGYVRVEPGNGGTYEWILGREVDSESEFTLTLK